MPGTVNERRKGNRKKLDTRETVLKLFPKNAVGAEVGVFRGRFSRRILDNCMPKKLFLVDPWQNFDDPDLSKSWYAKGSENDMDATRESVLARFSSEIDLGQIEVCHGKSDAILSGFADNSLDFIYIDGDHRYEGVASDLAQAMRVVKQNGLIVADDYALGGWWKDGVVRAVNEFLGTHAGKLRVEFVRGGQFVMRKMELAPTDLGEV